MKTKAKKIFLTIAIATLIISSCLFLVGCQKENEDSKGDSGSGATLDSSSNSSGNATEDETPPSPDYPRIVFNTGSAGEHITWTYYSDNTFEFTGYGAMYDTETPYPDWTNYTTPAKSITFSDEITTLAWRTLWNARGITEILVLLMKRLSSYMMVRSIIATD